MAASKVRTYLDLGVGLPAALAGKLVPPVAEHPAVKVCDVGGGTSKHDEIGDTGGSPVCVGLVNMSSRSGGRPRFRREWGQAVMEREKRELVP